MNPSSDTLDIQPLRLGSDLPIAAVARAERANHPEAAEAARARIAQLTEPTLGLPTLTDITTGLITDKAALAQAFGARPKLVPKPKVPSRLQPLLVAVAIFCTTILVFKAPVIINEIRFGLHPQTASVSTASATLNAAAPVSASPTIIIPKINVNAPMVYINSTNETDFETALQSGVVHYATTSLPGQPGNAVFFGHSSNDWWVPGNYKFVFVLLDKLSPGDQFTIDYNSKAYTYEVTGSQVVPPTDMAVLDQTSTPTVTLVTCTPPGTSWNRLVVTAKQITPAPPGTVTASTTGSPSGTTGAQASTSPSFLDQVGSGISSAWHGVLALFGADHQSSTSTNGSTTATQLPAAN